MPGVMFITANTRLARALRLDYDKQQVRQGLEVWPAPDIIPLGAFLERCWRTWLYRTAEKNPVQLLSVLQERSIWEDIIARSTAGRELVQAGATAVAALDAWNLAHAWHVPFDSRDWADSRDTEAFRDWAEEFQRLCQKRDWLTQARLPEFIAEKIIAREIPVPLEVRLAGFSEFSPVQETLFDAMRGANAEVEIHRAATPQQSTSAVRSAFADTHAEIRAAASWARKLLEAAADSSRQSPSIGIVVAELSRLRSEIERTFAEELHPGSRLSPERDFQRAFNISLGPALPDYALVHIAFVVLRMNPEKVPINEISSLLRSPYIAGAHTQSSLHAQLDVRLRRLREPTLSLSEVAAQAPAELRSALNQWQSVYAAIPSRQLPGDWSVTYSRLLKAIGWPGQRPLNSSEYQTIHAWNSQLSDFAALDSITGLLPHTTALSMLQHYAADRQFQPESDPAPIQILGELEASGLEFDHLWIFGMHDGAWPRSNGPNPFLPRSLQRLGNLPQSSPRRELEFANRVTEQLLASAPDIIVSYPEKEGDSELRPSPLFASLPEIEAEELGLPSPRGHAELLFESSPSVETIEVDVPPQWSGSRFPGGTSIFKKQGACPFQAFAHFRLGAEPMETATPGLSALDRGDLLHTTLLRVWKEFGSHETLMDAAPEYRNAVVHDEVHTSIREMAAKRRALRQPRFAEIEQSRLERLVTEWLEFEKRRQPFEVIRTEIERLVSIGGVELKIRPDRVDKLADGTCVIIDYKTGVQGAARLDGDRPDEPQLPIYAVTSDVPLSGVAFGVARLGEMKFAGVAASEGILPNVRPHPDGITIPDQIRNWNSVLDRLAADFRSGAAAVDPKRGNQTCRNCGLDALCRVGDRGRSPQDAEEVASPDGDSWEAAPE
jgi:probable DNA repair protein